MNDNNNELLEKINELEDKIKKNKIRNIIILLIIIILIINILIICLLCYKMGAIGYRTLLTSGDPSNAIDVVTIKDENGKEWNDTYLNIFKNEKFNGEKIIAPHSIGTYQFYVTNKSKESIAYNLRLLDEMNHFINMKYKLKIDNVYICGDEDTYVGIEELNIDNIILMNNSTTLYTLEWYWEDDDVADTFVGSLDTDEYYTLRLNIQIFSPDDR